MRIDAIPNFALKRPARHQLLLQSEALQEAIAATLRIVTKLGGASNDGKVMGAADRSPRSFRQLSYAIRGTVRNPVGRFIHRGL